MSARVLLIAMMTLFLAGSSFGQALSKQNLIDLKKSGVTQSVLLKQIEKDGISFDMNAATTIELKNLGFADEVLSALLTATSKKSPVDSRPAADNNPIRTLYTTGKFPELADYLRSSLKTNPNDYKNRALLVMTLVKMKETDAAHAEFQQLAAHEQDPAAAPLVKQVKTLFDSLEKTEQAKTKLIAALKGYQVSDAAEIVDQLPASATQKEILKTNLDVYQAKYDQARDRFSKINFGSYSEKERSTKIRDHINEIEATYKKLMSRTETYLYSPLAPSYCHFTPGYDQSKGAYAYSKEFLALSVQEYLDLVNKLTELAPLSDDVMNLGFHAQLLTGNYDQLEPLGDRLLKTKGSIRLPFFASDRFFRLVIDAQKKRIYTEPDPHEFKVKYSNPKHGNGSHWGEESPVNTWWAELVPFDFAFDQITKISQKGNRFGPGTPLIVDKSYALKFEPTGVAPNYALMNILFCTGGEKAELTVTRDLGRYIVHVIGANNSVKAELADPSKAKGPSSGWFTGLLMMGAMTSTDPSLRTAAVEGLKADRAQQAVTFQAQQAAWESITARDTFNLVEAYAFTGLEELLGVLN